MIECENCDTAQFLQIVQSRVYFEDGDVVSEIEEKYECTVCEATGKYVYDEDEDEETVMGDVEHTTDRPKFA